MHNAGDFLPVPFFADAAVNEQQWQHWQMTTLV